MYRQIIQRKIITVYKVSPFTSYTYRLSAFCHNILQFFGIILNLILLPEIQTLISSTNILLLILVDYMDPFALSYFNPVSYIFTLCSSLMPTFLTRSNFIIQKCFVIVAVIEVSTVIFGYTLQFSTHMPYRVPNTLGHQGNHETN